MARGNCEYVRKAYGVPAEIGRRVTVGGREGIITVDRGPYVGVTFDDEKVSAVHCFHPTSDGLVYGEMGVPRKLTRSQMRYRRYLEVADCFESFGAFLRWDARAVKA